ncbi:MAG: ABC transporter permease [Eubacteriales bacterium]|nr:ABC transporter permease [Eubacteriales bacterium]
MNLSAILNIITGALEQGLIYGILALGLLITYRILDFPDLTVDSSFPLGAAITALMTVNGYPPVLSLFAAAAAGAVAGLVTGLIHVRCHVRDLLSGIITMTGLYSINLRIAGKANLPFFANATLFKNPFTKSLAAWIAPYSTLIIILLIVLAAKLLLDWYLKTKAGFLLRAAGDNASVVTTLARDVGTTKIIGLMIANALVALSGAVMAQHQRSFDISMGTGTMVTGLASVIIGTNLFKNLGWMKSTTMVIIGSVLYKLCVSAAISCGLEAQDMKLITAVLFLLILIFAQTQFKRKKVRIHA